jgi:hypothetical protein
MALNPQQYQQVIVKARNAVWVVLICAALGMASGSLAAGPGTTGADVLKVSLGARPNALGGAYSAMDPDAQSLLYNPAALWSIAGADALFQHYAAFEEVSYELIGYAQPVEDMGTVGGALVWRHLPAIDNPGAPDAPVNAMDMVAAFGAGRLWKEWISSVPPLFDRLAVGGAVKIIYSSLREAHAVSAAADMGLTWSAPASFPLPLTAAAALQNAGAPMRFLEQADPLPLCGRFGVSAIPLALERHKAIVTAEWVVPMDNDMKTSVGAEYTLAGVLSFRAGYRFENAENINGPSAGLGISFPAGTMRLRLDYSYRMTLWKGYETLDNNHFFSLGARF